jgi:hypothetical protein
LPGVAGKLGFRLCDVEVQILGQERQGLAGTIEWGRIGEVEADCLHPKLRGLRAALQQQSTEPWPAALAL